MKLKKYIQTQERSGRPLIRLNMRTGLFTITKPAVRKIGGDAKHCIGIYQDEDCERDFYLTLEKEGIRLRDDKNFGALFFNSSGLKGELNRVHKITERTAVFVIGAPTDVDGKLCYPLLYQKQ